VERSKREQVFYLRVEAGFACEVFKVRSRAGFQPAVTIDDDVPIATAVKFKITHE
jgi:hypothetical protein